MIKILYSWLGFELLFYAIKVHHEKAPQPRPPPRLNRPRAGHCQPLKPHPFGGRMDRLPTARLARAFQVKTWADAGSTGWPPQHRNGHRMTEGNMCRYKRAEQRSDEMHSARMCRECHLTRCRESSRRNRARQKAEHQPTMGECIAQHKANPMYQVWV